MGIRLKNAYFKWLKLMVISDKNHEYDLLLKELHSVKFRWLVANDINRMFDGCNLRDRFSDELDGKVDESLFLDEVSVLEVLIGLSLRCEWIMMNDSNGLDVSYWFMEFLRNLELDIFADEDFYTSGGRAKIKVILDSFMNRTYTKTGKGGIFPLKISSKNQRKIELWYQMNSYLVENYII